MERRFVVRPCGTFCTHPLRYSDLANAKSVARYLVETQVGECRVNEEEEIAPDCLSVKPLGYYHRMNGEVAWQPCERPEASAAEIIGSDVRGYRQAA